MGAVTFSELVARFGSVDGALDDATRHDAGVVMRARAEADEAFVRAERCGASVYARTDVDYPRGLRDLRYPPPIVFTRGRLDAIAPPVAAVVGTRRATAYGERVTRDLTAALARAGVCILSGLARGIDAAAHRAALEAGGRTAAVLGTGVDQVYPTQHDALHARIAAEGVLLSEELPGDRASAGSFPKRNRLLAALAEVTIVIEAPHQSGALITANHALDLGRVVAAVPGPIDAPASAGSNLLLRDGAVLLAEPADALALFGLAPPRVPPDPELASSAERAVWTALATGATSLDELCARAALPARECLAAVSALEIRGAVECALTGEVRRR